MTNFREIKLGRSGVEIVASEQDTTLGSVFVTKNGSTSKIGYIGVKPDYQGEGVGEKLLTQALQWSKQKGCDTSESSLIPVPGKQDNVIKMVTKSGGIIDKKGNVVFDLKNI